MFKVYKSSSDSLTNYIIINCIVFSIILNYLIFIIKLLMGAVPVWKNLQYHNIFAEKHPVEQHFILAVCMNRVQ